MLRPIWPADLYDFLLQSKLPVWEIAKQWDKKEQLKNKLSCAFWTHVGYIVHLLVTTTQYA